MIFTKTYTTMWHDTNACRTVRPTQLLVYMQETSNHHMTECGLSLDRLRDEKGLAFILSKIRMSIYKPLYAFEEITVETWTCPCHALSIPRCYRIKRGEEIIAEADTTWALLSLDTHGFIRGDDCDVFSFKDEAPASLDIPTRFKLPRTLELSPIGKRKIVWSDLDYNMHMNNTRYLDMLCDFLPHERLSKIRGFLLSYVNEAAFGDELQILSATDENTVFIRTVNADGKLCLEALVLFE